MSKTLRRVTSSRSLTFRLDKRQSKVAPLSTNISCKGDTGELFSQFKELVKELTMFAVQREPERTPRKTFSQTPSVVDHQNTMIPTTKSRSNSITNYKIFKKKKKLIKLSASAVTQLDCWLIAIRKQRKDICWSIFVHDLLQVLYSKQSTFEDSFSVDWQQKYQIVLQSLLADEHKLQVSTAAIKEAKLFLQYLGNYSTDPYSILIGNIPTQQLLDKVIKVSTKEKEVIISKLLNDRAAVENTLMHILSWAFPENYEAPDYSINDCSVVQGRTRQSSISYLAHTFFNSNSNQSAKEEEENKEAINDTLSSQPLQIRIRQYVQTMRSNSDILAGEIVIVNTETGWRFARCTNQSLIVNTPKSIDVWLSVDEEVSTNFLTSHVFRIPPLLLEEISEASPLTMHKFAFAIEKKIEAEINDTLDKEITNSLKSIGIDLAKSIENFDTTIPNVAIVLQNNIKDDAPQKKLQEEKNQDNEANKKEQKGDKVTQGDSEDEQKLHSKKKQDKQEKKEKKRMSKRERKKISTKRNKLKSKAKMGKRGIPQVENLEAFVPFSELHYIASACEKLDSPVYHEAVTSITAKVQDSVSTAIAEGISILTSRNMFNPNQNEILEAMQRFLVEDAVNSKMQAVKKTFLDALAQLEQQKLAIIRGQRKNEVSKTWLLSVRAHTTAHLLSLGFVDGVIGKDYLSTPPNDIEAVQKNFLLLTHILQSFNSREDKYQVREIILKVQSEAYPLINKLIIDSKALAMHMLGVSEDVLIKEVKEQMANQQETESDKSSSKQLVTDDMPIEISDALQQLEIEILSLEKLSEIASQKLANSIITTTMEKSLQLIINDLAYLVEMKVKDNLFSINKEVQFGSAHVVPLCGLVLSKIFRLENEHKSVLSYFCPKIDVIQGVADDASCNEEDFRLSTSVILGDENLFLLLLTQIGDLNAKDEHGNTALHFAVNSTNRLVQFAAPLIIRKEVNVLAKNSAGDTPLHCLARHKHVDKVPQFYSILSQLIKRVCESGNEENKGINVTNNKGETPLHVACLHGTSKTCSLLLEAKADPNQTTSAGESSIHFGARNKRHGIELMKMFKANKHHKADFNLTAANGLTPLDIAHMNDNYFQARKGSTSRYSFVSRGRKLTLGKANLARRSKFVSRSSEKNDPSSVHASSSSSSSTSSSSSATIAAPLPASHISLLMDTTLDDADNETSSAINTNNNSCKNDNNNNSDSTNNSDDKANETKSVSADNLNGGKESKEIESNIDNDTTVSSISQIDDSSVNDANNNGDLTTTNDSAKNFTFTKGSVSQQSSNLFANHRSLDKSL